MEIDKDKGHLIFKNGTRISCAFLIVGLDPEGNIFEGYDAFLFNKEHSETCNGLSLAQRIEICDYMIERWKEVQKAAILEATK